MTNIELTFTTLLVLSIIGLILVLLYDRKLRNLKKKRVLARVDFNVPIKNKKVLDDSRLLACLPTIEFLAKKGAKIILVSHLGRPEGKIVRSLKLDAVARHLSLLLGKKIKKMETGNWDWTEKRREYFKKQIENMRAGEAVMLDNIRFSADEEKNRGPLAKMLAELADIFVLDGFAVSHRASSSVVGIAKFLPSYAGLLLEREVTGMEKVIKSYKKPYIAIIGGVKVETKAPVIKNLLPKVDFMLVGGGIFNTCLKAMGYKVGGSVIDEKYKREVLKYCRTKKVILPVDVVVGDKDGQNYRVVELKKTPHKVCDKDEAVYDIGPRTIRLFSLYIKKARTLVWNGAMGYFEQKPYNTGTLSVARLVASRSKGKAFGVIGGGETLQAMAMTGMSEYVDLISTGGGAMLEFLSGKELVGIKALTLKHKNT